MFFANRKHFWGIDIGASSVKGVQLSRTRHGVQLQDAAIVEISEDEGALSNGLSLLLGKSLAKARAAVHFSGRVSPEIRTLSLPSMPKKEMIEAVHWEARKSSSLSNEALVVDFLTMREREIDGIRQHEVVIVVVDRAALADQLQKINGCGLNVIAVDVAPMALLNTARLHFSEQLPDCLLYVDIGAKNMEINIVNGGVLRFTRQVMMGGDAINLALSEAFGWSFSDAESRKRKEGILTEGSMREAVLEQVDRFIVEIQRSVDYYRAESRAHGIDKILLMGGMPLLPGFLEYFSRFFEAPIEIEDPFSMMRCEGPEVAMLREIAPQFSLATGLALRKG
ncbi:MAG: type IV pilus assembly protein PilM [Nitrospiria bacterium]